MLCQECAVHMCNDNCLGRCPTVVNVVCADLGMARNRSVDSVTHLVNHYDRCLLSLLTRGLYESRAEADQI